MKGGNHLNRKNRIFLFSNSSCVCHRAIRTIVLSSFPEKQTKPGPHQMNM